MNGAADLISGGVSSEDAPLAFPPVSLDVLDEALASGEGRKTALCSALEQGRGEIRTHFEKTPLSGIEAGIALTTLQDQLIGRMFAHAQESFPLPHPTKSERIAVVAVGGYGRGLLAPGSDIDLLFLTPYKRTAWVENMVETMLYELWDLGQKVGQATRSVDECLRLARSDMTIRTSLLETRLISGDADLYEELRQRLWDELFSDTAAEFAREKLAERETRHRRVGDSRYLLEPNVKEGKGALRDLHSLFWIAKYTYHVDHTRDLIEKGVFTFNENRRFEDAERFLWTVRFWLHYLAGRAQEQLSYEHQLAIAEAMGYTGNEGQSAVECFMMQYFTVAKEVGDLTGIICAALEAQQIAPERRARWRLPNLLRGRKDEGDILLQNGRIVIEDAATLKDAPITMLRVFLDSARNDTPIHPATLKMIRRSVEHIDDGVRTDPVANEIFLEILMRAPDPEKTLRGMNEAGVLGRFMPEFGRIVCMMQFNMYHHYTVDEHTIQAVGNLRAIEEGALKDEAPLASALMQGAVDRRVLYIAMLLHDIGKGRPEDHSILGAEIAQTVCPRLGLSAQETESVVWLIRHHLLMSDTAQKRDLADEETIRSFAEEVKILERLNMLLVLTVCDIRAVGPGTWNGWKAQLLRTLFHETRALLSAGHDAVVDSRRERTEAAQQSLREKLTDWSDEEYERFACRHYPPYWLGMDSETHEVHARMLRGNQAEDTLLIDTSSDPMRSVMRLSLAMGDHPGLFSRVTGAVALAGSSIVEARTFTTSDGLALVTLWLQDQEGEAFDDPHRLERLGIMVRDVMQGEVQPHLAFEEREDARLENRERNFTVPPRVAFDNAASELFTVIEVTGRDRMGLLHDLARAITTNRASIFSAVIATYGERAVDTFYVKDLFGHKITGEKHQKAIEAALIDVLSDSDETEAA